MSLDLSISNEGWRYRCTTPAFSATDVPLNKFKSEILLNRVYSRLLDVGFMRTNKEKNLPHPVEQLGKNERLGESLKRGLFTFLLFLPKVETGPGSRAD